MSEKSIVAQTVLDLCYNSISAAVNAENVARDKWAKAGKALYKAGARIEALTKGTKDEPNPYQDDSLIETVEKMIVSSLTACVKPMEFDGGKYTVGDLLNLTREALREADNPVLSQTRRHWQQQVGSLFNLVRKYVDRVQNPDKTQAPKNGGKKNEVTESADPIVTIQGWINQATKMVDVADVSRFQDAGHEMIACLRRIRKS